MSDYTLSAKALVLVQGSSKGTQPKYFDRNFWYKVNQLGYEGKSEYLVSKVLECSNIKDYVKYEECTINGRSGCRSKNFIGENESYISFQRLYKLYTGQNLTDQVRRISEVSDRIGFVIDFVKSNTGLECKDYLSKILALDMLILNTDRHFNNLGIIVNSTKNIYRPAPVFDNGSALLSDWDRFDEEELRDNIDKVIGQPFAANLEVQANAVGIGLKLNYSKLSKELKDMPSSRGLDVLKYQLNRYQNVISEIKEPKVPYFRQSNNLDLEP